MQNTSKHARYNASVVKMTGSYYPKSIMKIRQTYLKKLVLGKNIL
jgi:hypothetical protein